jgi:hypothetical protein
VVLHRHAAARQQRDEILPEISAAAVEMLLVVDADIAIADRSPRRKFALQRLEVTPFEAFEGVERVNDFPPSSVAAGSASH